VSVVAAVPPALRWLLGGVLLAALAVLVCLGAPDVAAVHHLVGAAGVWAPAVFVLVQVVATVGPVPRTVFTIAAGVLFGSVWGLLVAVGATVVAAVVAFLLVRRGTVRMRSRFADRRALRWVHVRLHRRALLAVTSLRLMPVAPFPVANYLFGVSGVAFVPYLVGTVIGVLPGTVAVVVLSDSLAGGTPDPRLFTISIVCGVLGTVGALLTVRRPVPPAA